MKNSKFNNKYFMAGLTAFCVLIAALLVGFLIFNFNIVSKAVHIVNAALMPVYIGIAIAYLLSPMVNFIERKLIIPGIYKLTHKRSLVNKLGRGTSVVITMVVFLAMMCWIVMLVVPEVIDSVINFGNDLPNYYRNIVKQANELSEQHPQVADYIKQTASSGYEQLGGWLRNEIIPTSTNVLSTLSDGLMSAIGMLVNVIIGLVISIYLLFDKELFCAQGKRILYAVFSNKIADHIVEIGGDMNWYFSKFFAGKIIDSVIVGILTFITMTIAGVPYAALVSVLIGVTNVIPFFGVFLGIIPSGILVLLANPLKFVLFLVLAIIIIQLDANIIGPKIIGESIGLGSFWILFAILVFGSLFGVLGMICAVPIFAVVYKNVKKWTRHRLVRKGMPVNTENYKRMNFERQDKI